MMMEDNIASNNSNKSEPLGQLFCFFFLHKLSVTHSVLVFTFQIWYWPSTENIRTAKVAEFGKVFSGVITGLEKDKLYQMRVFGTSSGGDGKKTPPTYFTLGRYSSLPWVGIAHFPG